MKREEIRKTLRTLKPAIDQKFQADVEGFFGSQARGDAGEGSDLDVLVRFRTHAGLYELVELGDFLEGIFHCRVDIVSARALPEEFAAHISANLVRI